MESIVGAGVSQGIDAINVVGRAAMYLGTAIDNAIEVRAVSLLRKDTAVVCIFKPSRRRDEIDADVDLSRRPSPLQGTATIVQNVSKRADHIAHRVAR